MQAATVCFLTKGEPVNELLLGLKKAGFGAGKYAGIEGKVEAGEEVETAVRRDVFEEINIQIPKNKLQYVVWVQFLFPAKPTWNQDVSIFRAELWDSLPQESGEIKPIWFTISDIPYDLMWQDAPYWLPLILEGKQIRATITFQEDNETVR